MSHLIKDILRACPHDYISEQEISILLGNKMTSVAKANLVMRFVKKGHLIRLKRGLFILGKDYRRHSLNLFEISDILYHPSYVGLHSALSYYNAIPEAVYSTTCITTNRSKGIDTPIGRFSYKYVNEQIFKIGLSRQATLNGSFLISTLEKTILDFLYIYKREWLDLRSLSADIRFDEEVAESINPKNLSDLAPVYKSKRVEKFVSQLIKDFN